MGNLLRTTILLSIMTIFLMLIGQLLGGRSGMLIALVFAAGMNFFSYWYSDKIVLRMYRAREVTPNEWPEIYHMVEALASKAGLPTPGIYLIPEDTPNAFATGRNPGHAVVAVTEGLVHRLAPDELAGVIAHELGHIKGRDILIGSIAATMAGAVMMLASMARWSAIFGGFRSDDHEGGLGGIGLLLMSIIAPIGAMIIQMAISRSREYAADDTAAEITGNPEGLAGALEKISAYSRRIPMDAAPATAHMFIVNPLSGNRLNTLFSTHPPIEQRIRRLRGHRPPKDGGKFKDSERGLADGAALWDRLAG